MLLLDVKYQGYVFKEENKKTKKKKTDHHEEIKFDLIVRKFFENYFINVCAFNYLVKT